MASPLASHALSSGEKIKVVLVGTGVRGTSFWGKTLVKDYPDILEFVGLCDINPGRLEYARGYMGVTCPTYTDFEQMVKETKPDLVIYLQAPVEVLLDRVKKRGRNFERFIETNYLERIVEAYTRFFYYYTDTPLLIVNATDIDLVDKVQDYDLLVDQLRKVHTGRHYFNPGSFDL